MSEKTLEQKIAHFIRMLGSEHDGEALNAARLLGKTLTANGATFNEFGDAIEKFANGGLEEDAMQRIFAAGEAQGAEKAEKKHVEAQAVFGLNPDGTNNWERIAVYVQREKARLESRHHEFIDDMSSRMAFGGREPTPKQATYLLSLFRKIGGRM